MKPWMYIVALAGLGAALWLFWRRSDSAPAVPVWEPATAPTGAPTAIVGTRVGSVFGGLFAPPPATGPAVSTRTGAGHF